MTLKELQEYYPEAKYEPRPECPYCEGEGIVKKPKLRLGFRACICTFVKNMEGITLFQEWVEELVCTSLEKRFRQEYVGEFGDE